MRVKVLSLNICIQKSNQFMFSSEEVVGNKSFIGSDKNRCVIGCCPNYRFFLTTGKIFSSIRREKLMDSSRKRPDISPPWEEVQHESELFVIAFFIIGLIFFEWGPIWNEKNIYGRKWCCGLAFLHKQRWSNFLAPKLSILVSFSAISFWMIGYLFVSF